MSDLTAVIEQAIDDVELPDEPVETESASDDTPAEPVETASSEATPETPATEESVSPEVPSPAAKAAAEPKLTDEFEKKYGISANSSSGRENRIPYARVKKITEKAAKDASETVRLEFTPKITEFETKVKDYESRLGQVAEFERIMLNEPDRFIGMLETIPAYKSVFEKLHAPAPEAPQEAPAAPVDEEMPQPDQELPDGNKVYSLEGLKALNAWNRSQARKEVLADVDKRFGPMAQEWEAHQKRQALIPQVQKQIDEAKSWPQFSENEVEIVKALQSNSNLTLEGAYRQVVFTKLQEDKARVEEEKSKIQSSLKVDRDKMRAEILKEIQGTPRSTSVSSQTSKSTVTPSTGSRTLEEIIAEAVSTLK